MAFAVDPQLGQLSTPNGRLTFLATVGVTDDELAAMKATSTASVLETLSQASPTFVIGVR